MATCYLGIGSNLGDRRKYIDKAIAALDTTGSIKVKRSSSIYETDPVGPIPQGKFLNGILEIETSLSPHDLLSELKKIEKNLGRLRIIKDGPRVIDMDILYYDDMRLNENGLVIPHPKINQREFVLKGLRELGKA